MAPFAGILISLSSGKADSNSGRTLHVLFRAGVYWVLSSSAPQYTIKPDGKRCSVDLPSPPPVTWTSFVKFLA